MKLRYGTPGLQNSLLGSTGAFEVIGGRKEFIQVLHSNKYHWLTISTIDCYPVVKVYDSMNTAIPLSTKQQICSILMPTERLISLEFVAVDRQNNSNDCGVFALAFATALCAGEDPQYLHFKTEGTSMRDHLLQCLENGAIQPFPSEMLKRRRARRDMKNDKIEVFCTCRSTEDKDMLGCVKCGEMLHRTCIKESNRKDCSITWLCDSCSCAHLSVNVVSSVVAI